MLVTIRNYMAKAEVWVVLIALYILCRNVFYTQWVIGKLYKDPYYKLNTLFVRCSSAYVTANGKKSFHRMYFFNIIRCVLPEYVRAMVYEGKISCAAAETCFLHATIYTIVFHYLPMKYFKRLRWLWCISLFEFYMK